MKMDMRIKCTVSYDGTGYSGYQVQPNKRTVQGEIESVLTKLHKGQKIAISASGRTDAGVHAKGQVFHFDTPLRLPEDKWSVAMNSLLPPDISVHKAEAANADFHARFDAVEKEYRYFIHLSSVRDPFKRNYAYRFPYPLDLEAIEAAKKYLIGTHDFTSFCSAKTEIVDRVRTLKRIELLQEDDMLIFRFVGNGFLYNMVRILVGTLLEVGQGERQPYHIMEVLEKRDRRSAGKTAPGQGLYLWEVRY
nr:tRNA pseudouridine(38-40) synthase TruA [Mesobacillus foraminis]